MIFLHKYKIEKWLVHKELGPNARPTQKKYGTNDMIKIWEDIKRKRKK